MSSNRPSAAFLAHHDVQAPRVDARAFRPGWRVRTRLESLLRLRLILPREFAAACAFRSAWDRASGGATRSTLGSDGSPRGEGGHLSLGSLDDARRLAEVALRLSPRDAMLVFACVICDQTWAEIARRMTCDPTTVPTRAARAVRTLCTVWDDEGTGS